MVSKIAHTRMRVNDLEKTVRFYKEALGLEETGRHKSPRGSELVFLKAPNSEEELEICHYPASGPVSVPEDLMHVAFEVDDFEALEKNLKAKGIPFSDGPHRSSTGAVFAFIDAPEKYEIELICRGKK